MAPLAVVGVQALAQAASVLHRRDRKLLEQPDGTRVDMNNFEASVATEASVSAPEPLYLIRKLRVSTSKNRPRG